MASIFSSLMTIILLIVVIFAIKVFIETIQEDIKDFKEKYQFTKQLISSIKESNIFHK
jgi:hypothetical protein